MAPPVVYGGWIVLAASFFCAMLVIGGTIYVYQLFVLPATAELGISRGSASNAFIALLLGIAIWSPVAGRLFDRMSARLLMPLGGIAYAAGMITVASTGSPVAMLLAVFVFLGLANALAGGLAANTLAARWFARRRGRALGIASIASSAGGFAMIPVLTALITRFGWRQALLVAGACIGATIVTLALLFIRDRPDVRLMTAAGEIDVTSAPVGEAEWTFSKLTRSRQFWLIALSVGLLLASDQAILTSQFPYFLDIGLETAQAAAIVTAMTGSAILGKLLVGFLAERLDVRWLYGMVALFHAALLAVLLVQPGFLFMLVFVSIFGAAVGGIYPVWSVLVSQHFGAASFGIAFGAMALFTQVLAITFVAFANRLFDATGTYTDAYLAFIGAVVLGMVVMAMVRRISHAPQENISWED
ncbi:MFS transporter [Croceicoccus sp. F390]|uniref:MFS transporter n=1 Tax=Croceicoccus esteveae TaxID=3075597 RepID=A0ABU2ZHB9_9SPHN|nr:MFS transporter [Croceicoccus sp. F390]MDT0575601.1 MFS transporter [Croceicoccus sp. F390]